MTVPLVFCGLGTEIGETGNAALRDIADAEFRAELFIVKIVTAFLPMGGS